MRASEPNGHENEGAPPAPLPGPRIGRLATLVLAALIVLAGVSVSVRARASATAPHADQCACAPGCKCDMCVDQHNDRCGSCVRSSSPLALEVHSPPRLFPHALPCTRATLSPHPVRITLAPPGLPLPSAHAERLLRPPRPSLAA